MRIAKDISLNFISNMLVTLSLHLLMYPILSREQGEEAFGLFLFIMATINMSSSIVGGSSNTVYFKYLNDLVNIYNKSMTFVWLNSLIVFIFLVPVFLNENLRTFEILIILIICFLMSLRIYIIGLLRAHLDYFNIIINNIFLSFLYGCISIIILFKEYNIFYLLLLSEVLYLMFFLFRYKSFSFLKVDFSVKPIRSSIYIILFSMVLVNLIKYLDRFYLNYIGGYEWVAYFFAAAIVGKILNVPLSNISTVAFSYFIQPDFITKKLLKKLLIIIPLTSILVVAIGYFIGPLIIWHLYPQYYEKSIDAFYILNVGIGFSIIYEILRGLIIKMYTEKIKLILEAITLSICISILLIFHHMNPFILLSIAISVAYFSRSFIVTMLVYKKIKEY